MSKIGAIAVVVLLAGAALVRANIYVWKDEAGVEHFTNRLEAVPEAYRAYMVKRIIHDWDDDRATMILTACRRAMNGKGKILIFDEVLPERAAPAAAFSFMLDMEMLVVAPELSDVSYCEAGHSVLGGGQIPSSDFGTSRWIWMLPLVRSPSAPVPPSTISGSRPVGTWFVQHTCVSRVCCSA